MSFYPKRGDVVAYGEYLYFFQANGTQCHLYRASDHVGIKAKRVLSPRRTAIRPPPDAAQRDAFLARDAARRTPAAAPPPRPPILPNVETDEESA